MEHKNLHERSSLFGYKLTTENILTHTRRKFTFCVFFAFHLDFTTIKTVVIKLFFWLGCLERVNNSGNANSKIFHRWDWTISDKDGFFRKYSNSHKYIYIYFSADLVCNIYKNRTANYNIGVHFTLCCSESNRFFFVIIHVAGESMCACFPGPPIKLQILQLPPHFNN